MTTIADYFQQPDHAEQFAKVYLNFLAQQRDAFINREQNALHSYVATICDAGLQENIPMAQPVVSDILRKLLQQEEPLVTEDDAALLLQHIDLFPHWQSMKDYALPNNQLNALFTLSKELVSLSNKYLENSGEKREEYEVLCTNTNTPENLAHHLSECQDQQSLDHIIDIYIDISQALGEQESHAYCLQAIQYDEDNNKVADADSINTVHKQARKISNRYLATLVTALFQQDEFIYTARKLFNQAAPPSTFTSLINGKLELSENYSQLLVEIITNTSQLLKQYSSQFSLLGQFPEENREATALWIRDSIAKTHLSALPLTLTALKLSESNPEIYQKVLDALLLSDTGNTPATAAADHVTAQLPEAPYIEDDTISEIEEDSDSEISIGDIQALHQELDDVGSEDGSLFSEAEVPSETLDETDEDLSIESDESQGSDYVDWSDEESEFGEEDQEELWNDEESEFGEEDQDEATTVEGSSLATELDQEELWDDEGSDFSEEEEEEEEEENNLVEDNEEALNDNALNDQQAAADHYTQLQVGLLMTWPNTLGVPDIEETPSTPSRPERVKKSHQHNDEPINRQQRVETFPIFSSFFNEQSSGSNPPAIHASEVTGSVLDM